MSKSYVFAAILTAFCGITAQAGLPDFNVPQPRYYYPDYDPLVEAQMMAIEVGGGLQPDEGLTQQILNDLALIRATYPDMEDIRYWAPYAPKQMLVGLTEAAAEQFKAGNYHGLDSLNEQYGIVAIDARFYHASKILILTFEEVYNMELLSDIYEQAHPYGLIYAEPNYRIGDGSTIIAKPPYYTFSERWGDCPAGCTEGRNWNFYVENGQAILQVAQPAPATVMDTEKPHFRLRVRPRVLKPMNYEMVGVSVEWMVHDDIDPSPEVSLVNIVVVEHGKIIADMSTSDDIAVTYDGAIYLRAARTNAGFRRTYVITYQAQDDSGNVTIRRAKVRISRKQVKKIQADTPLPDLPVPVPDKVDE